MRQSRLPVSSALVIRILGGALRWGPFRRSLTLFSGWRELCGRLILILSLGVLPLDGAAAQTASIDLAAGPQSGLPLPRFVSLKADRVNVRGGPTKDHEVVWVFTSAGLPVEITAEFENWRRIRDWEGAEGWVYHSLLSGRRAAMVAKKKTGAELAPLYDHADGDGAVRARLEPGVVGRVKRCNGVRCQFVGEKFDGFIAQERLWGVYPGEKFN